MTGAMYAAIAGLKTHMSKMNVIGNNIANVNTNAYKSQRTIFKDALYTMYSNGSNGTEVVGSKNPAQIGYGSQVSSIDLNMASGTYTPGNAMDCMIDGDGYFLVGNKDVADVIRADNPESFKSLSLTRVGDFSFGADGYLVDGSGSTVYGFLSVGTNLDGNPIVSDQLVPIRLPRMEKIAVSMNEDTTDTVVGEEITEEMDEDWVEGQDYKYVYTVRYPVASVAANAGDDPLATGATATMLDDYWPAVADGAERPEENPLSFAQLDSISVDQSSGRITGTLRDTQEMITIGYLAIGTVTNPNGLTHTGGFYYSASAGAGDLQIALMGGEAENLTLPGGGKFTHVNGSLAPRDAEGNPILSKKAEIGSAGSTELITGGLEGSNVDLATEISDMITTQRGYQANTRIITVTDSMLEELVNMKR